MKLPRYPPYQMSKPDYAGLVADSFLESHTLHAIAANRMGIELKSQLYVAVAKQRLHSLWIGSDPDKK